MSKIERERELVDIASDFFEALVATLGAPPRSGPNGVTRARSR